MGAVGRGPLIYHMSLRAIAEWRKWLAEQSARDDLVGNFARYFLSDQDADGLNTISAIDRHLIARGCGEEMLGARDSSWREYRHKDDFDPWQVIEELRAKQNMENRTTMVKLYQSDNNGEWIVVTDATVLDHFRQNLAAAILEALQKREGDEEFTLEGILAGAFEIAFKIRGYKTDLVHEQRVLTCGHSAPDDCALIASSGVRITDKEQPETGVDGA